MNEELKELALSLIAYCQRHDLLPTTGDELIETLWELSPEASSETLSDLIG